LFKKILIANRGEIAIRVIRACQEMGIRTVAVYSEVDKDSLHVKLADQSFCIGPAAPAQSYLNIPRLISAAEVSGADAIHPGYGFLSENANFSEICAAHGIVFIGASPENIRMMGDKNVARETMKKFGVPLVPGSEGLVRDEEELLKAAKITGFPLMIKAVAGGGGKGMRLVEKEADLVSNFQLAQSEAKTAFGNPDVYIERFVKNPRHIEIQILSDRDGNAVHLGERDCTIQRRHQKLIEEAPSPVVSDQLRQKMGQVAVDAVKAIQYEGAGTIEFLSDPEGNFYFMEMNTRIQVEHTVTEEVTSIDLIREQIIVAATKKLGIRQSDVHINGHAIEFRINAEDPEKNFAPRPGTVRLYLPPGGPGVRMDSQLYPGYVVPSAYDSMIGKLIIWAADRDACIQRSKRALNELVIDGVPTPIPFYLAVLDHPKFISGDFDTGFIEKEGFFAKELANG